MPCCDLLPESRKNRASASADPSSAPRRSYNPLGSREKPRCGVSASPDDLANRLQPDVP